MKKMILLLLILATSSYAATTYAASVLSANKSSLTKITPKETAPAVKQKSHSELDVWLHQLTSETYQDIDQDGYFQNLSLSFDLDTRFISQDVLIEVWLQGSAGDDRLLYISDTIELYLDSTSDSQRIDIQLLENYQSDYYDIQLVVIDSSSGREIFRVDGFDNDQLQNLPLEGQSSDQFHEVSIYSANLKLIGDGNHNGFYDRFSVAIDVDYPHGSTELVAQFFLDDKLFYTSGSFWVTGNNTNDEQFFDIEINNNLTAGYYNLDVHLVDARDLSARHQVLALDWVEFNSLPLETVYDDSYDDDIDVHVDQHGGSVGFGFIALLLVAGLRLRLRYVD